MAWLGGVRVVLITDRRLMGDGSIVAFGDAVARAVAALPPSAALVQVREPDLDDRALLQLVHAAMASGAPVMVHDRLDVALAAGAAGVHDRDDADGVDRRRGCAVLKLLANLPQLAVAAGGRGGSGPSGGGGFATWVIVDDAIVQIDGRPRTFELAGWRAGRYTPHAPDAQTPIAVTPDWVCERAEPDRAAQLARDAGRGIGHVWLLDQIHRRIDAYRLDRAGWTRVASAAGGSVRLRAEPFEDIELDLSSLWGTHS